MENFSEYVNIESNREYKRRNYTASFCLSWITFKYSRSFFLSNVIM